MVELNIPEKEVTLELKQSVDELNPGEWLFYCYLIDELDRDRLYSEDFRVALLYKLLGLKMTKASDDYKLQNIAFLCQYLDGFFYQQEGQEVIDTHTVVNLLPTIHWDGQTCNGPGDLLQDVPFGRFVEAYQVFRDYAVNGTQEALPYLTDLLYQGEGALEKLPRYYHLSTYFFFQSCAEHLTTEPVVVAGEQLDFYQIFQGGEASEKGLAFDSVLFDLGENGVFGDVQKLKEQNLFEVLRYLLRRHYQTQKEKHRNAQRPGT